MIDEHGSNLIAVGLFIGTRMDRSMVKAQDLRAGQTQQDRRVRDRNELRSLFDTSVDLHQQRQLPLRGKSRFRLVQQVQSVRAETVLCQSQETFTM